LKQWKTIERDLFRLEGRRMKGKDASRKKGGKELSGAAFGLFCEVLAT
jgi:hypothetical protein